MKRLLSIIGLLLLLSNEYAQAHSLKPIEVETKGIKIQIIPRLELFHIMAYLNNADYLNNFEFSYKADVNAYFGSYKNDKNVQFVHKVLKSYYLSGAQLAINGLFSGKDFKNGAFAQLLTTDSFGLPNTTNNKIKIVDSLERAVDSFAKLSRYNKFVEKHKNYYHQKISDVATTIMNMDLRAEIESFFGDRKNKYSVVVTMLGANIHSYWNTNNPGQYSVFYLSPKFVVNNDAVFGNSNQTNLPEGKMAAKDYIYYGAGHEIGHSFLNPIIDHYANDINLLPLSTKETKSIFLCESILRSLTAFFMMKNNQNDFAQMVLQGEKQQGFIYNDKIVDLIKEYSDNRNKYRSFNDYIPELLNKLREQIK